MIIEQRISRHYRKALRDFKIVNEKEYVRLVFYWHIVEVTGGVYDEYE